MTYNTLIVLAGVGLLGGAAGLVGSFAVLRRRALLGDALSHAALPGLCIGFLIAGERHLPAMLLGALATGLLGVGVVSVLRHRTRIREDAAIGIVLSVFFGVGIVLSRLIQNSTTLAGSKAGLDSYILGKTAGMVATDVVLIGVAAAIALAIVLILFKEFLAVSFDPGFARAQGWPARTLDLVLTGLIAGDVVIGLPAVGVVMMAALLIIPGVSARFWSDRLSRVVMLAAIIGVGMGLAGTALSATYEKMPAGPIITLVGTGIFILSALLAPRRGLIARIVARRRERSAADRAELLRLLFEAEESKRSFDELAQLKAWSPGKVQRLLVGAERDGDVALDPSGPALTADGRMRAADSVRRYRLWRLLVAEYPDLVSLARPLTDEPIEATVPADVVADLVARLQTGRHVAEEGAV
jgi:manganese/zinc/iron transport system permease protein